MNNRIDLPGTVWIASDIHLSEKSVATAEAFYAFLAAAANDADALLLPGDIFDAWIGDDVVQIAPPWLTAALDALSAAGKQLQLWLGRGNRDFLIGQSLADRVGARLLPDVAQLHTDAGTILLSHGDEYCTDDQAYQQFRTMVRDPQWQSAFLAKSIPERIAMAEQARGESVSANQSKAASIMDVNADEIARAFRHSGVKFMIHGHTHRPGRHVLQVEGIRRERWVLQDWDFDHGESKRGGWLALDRDGLHFFDIDESQSA